MTSARTFTWTNQVGDVDWNRAGNWNPDGGPPQDGDNVIIPDADYFGRRDSPTPPGTRLADLQLGAVGLGADGSLIVAGSLSWTAGVVDADLTVLGAGTITGVDAVPGTGWPPAVINNHTVTVLGSLEIRGSGSPTSQFYCAGGHLLTSGVLQLNNAGIGGYGPAGSWTNRGTVTASGTCTVSPSAADHAAGSWNLGSGSRVILGGDIVLRLSGGRVTGDGLLVVGDGTDGGSAELDIVADTSVPNFVIAGNGSVAPAAGGAFPSPTAPGTLTVTRQLTFGYQPVGTSHYSTLLGHLVLARGAVGTVVGGAAITGGLLEVAGWLTVTDSATLQIIGPGMLVSGRLTQDGSGSISGGAVRNEGLIEKVGAGAGALDSDLSSVGSIAVRQGSLAVGSGDWTISGGTLRLMGGQISSAGSGTLVLIGGTGGGMLTGFGSVGAPTNNGGWVEPEAPGLTFSQGFNQNDEGNLLFPAGSVQAGTSASLHLPSGNISLGGSLWLLA